MSGSRHILRLIPMSSMQGKPLLAAVGAAEGRPLVLGVPYVDEDAAVPAVEGILYGLGLHVFRMLPVQPLAVGRAEFSPLICPMFHHDQLAAAQAAEGTKRLSCCPLGRRHFVLMAMPVRIAPADSTAILLRNAVGYKGFAADRAYCFPLHCSLYLPVHADVELIRVFVVIAEGLFYVEEHVRPLAELMGEAEAHVVPGAFVFVGRIEAARFVEGADILIA